MAVYNGVHKFQNTNCQLTRFEPTSLNHLEVDFIAMTAKRVHSRYTPNTVAVQKI